MIVSMEGENKMKISVYALAMETYVPALRTLSELLDKAAEHARIAGSDARRC
jgi:hypothetical protein